MTNKITEYEELKRKLSILFFSTVLVVILVCLADYFMFPDHWKPEEYLIRFHPNAFYISGGVVGDICNKCGNKYTHKSDMNRDKCPLCYPEDQ